MSRLLIGVLAAGFLIVPSSVRAEDDDPKAILGKAIKAHGGEEFLTKHMAGQAKNKGKITIAGVGEVEFTQETAYMLPDKFKESMELTVAGQKVNVVTLMNGDKISIESNGTAVPITDEIKKAMREATHMIKISRMIVLLKEKGFELNIAGEIKVDDKPAVGVRVSAKGQKDINLYFDKKTGLLAKIEHRPTDAATGNEITEERIILEYQKNEAGIPLPKKVVVKRDGKDFIVADVLEVKMLEKLNDSEFAK
jgi:hypothetical protein